MKKLILSAAVMFLASAAQAADTTLFKCVVDNNPVVVSFDVTLGSDVSADFVTMSLAEKSSSSVFFSQLEKGEVAEQMKNGYLNLLALTEKSGQVDGVIVNTGFLALNQESAGVYSGLLIAKGNIYPLSCKQ
ncbi:hypothetical protein D3C87_104440 [compost metagenome]